MRRTILHFTMSIDGFIADERGQLDWAFGFGPAVLPEADRVMRDAGAVISGRRGFDSDPGGRPYGGAWEGAVFVLSHRPAPDDADPGIRFLNIPITAAVTEAAEASGGRDVLLLSADLARQALDTDIVDEILLHIVPIVLGRGIRLFEGVGSARRFETRLTAQSGQVTTLLLARASGPGA